MLHRAHFDRDQERDGPWHGVSLPVAAAQFMRDAWRNRLVDDESAEATQIQIQRYISLSLYIPPWLQRGIRALLDAATTSPRSAAAAMRSITRGLLRESETPGDQVETLPQLRPWAVRPRPTSTSVTTALDRFSDLLHMGCDRPEQQRLGTRLQVAAPQPHDFLQPPFSSVPPLTWRPPDRLVNGEQWVGWNPWSQTLGESVRVTYRRSTRHVALGALLLLYDDIPLEERDWTGIATWLPASTRPQARRLILQTRTAMRAVRAGDNLDALRTFHRLPFEYSLSPSAATLGSHALPRTCYRSDPPLDSLERSDYGTRVERSPGDGGASA